MQFYNKNLVSITNFKISLPNKSQKLTGNKAKSFAKFKQKGL